MFGKGRKYINEQKRPNVRPKMNAAGLTELFGSYIWRNIYLPNMKNVCKNFRSLVKMKDVLLCRGYAQIFTIFTIFRKCFNLWHIERENVACVCLINKSHTTSCSIDQQVCRHQPFSHFKCIIYMRTDIPPFVLMIYLHLTN